MANTLEKEKIVENIVNEESIDALDSAIDVIKKEYGDFQLTAEMRQELAQELGESEEYANGWQKLSDILDHIDISILAKKHPEAIGKASKTVARIVSHFYPVAAAATIVPENSIAKIVEFAGLLTPEHIVNKIAKKQAEKAKTKHEQEKTAGTEQHKMSSSKLAGLFSKKASTPTPVPNEDIFETIRKLSELKDSGIITQDEFDIKKAQLLEKL